MQNQNNELDALAEELTLLIEVNDYGTIRYYNSDNKLHRVNGPAVIYTNGDKSWIQNDKYHRLDGPAIVCSDGVRSWYIDGKYHSEEAFKANPLVIAYAKSKQQ